MDEVQRNRQTLSELMDGELSVDNLRQAMAMAALPDYRADWDLYHQIGDSLRSGALSRPVSADFSRRMADRLAAEPTVLAPRRLPRLLWPVAATVAATIAGIFIAPKLPGNDQGSSPAKESVAASTVSHGALMSDPGTPQQQLAEGIRPAEYIFLHHRFRPALSGPSPWMQPEVLNPTLQP